MFKQTEVNFSALILTGTILALSSPHSRAQVQTIEVTGSRIKRVDAETASPIQMITREQIDRLGATSVSEILKTIPASNSGLIDDNEVASFTPGAGGVSLRGLGP